MPAPKSTLDVSGRPLALRDVDLDRFLDPRTVAVIGASESSRKPNTAMTTKLKAWADAHGAAFYPVHPAYETVAGERCYRSITEIPGEIDLAVILTGNAIDVFEEVRNRAAFAVIFAAGFSEVGKDGERLEARLDDLVRNSDTRLLGPNTNLNAFEDFRNDLAGPSIALITQSGHQGRPVFQGQEIGIRLTHWAPTGNEVDLEFADFAAYFADQLEVGVIAAYIEGFKDGRTLALAFDHAAKMRKPIVMVKVGRTEEGRSMAKSHTGHLTGSDAITSALFRQYGVTRVDGLDELLDVAATLARTRPAEVPKWGPKGPGVCVYSISGGTGAHMADMVAAAGLHLPILTKETQAALRDGLIPGYLRVSNPVDCGGGPVADARGRKILDLIVADPKVDVVVVPITGAVASFSDPFTRDLVEVARTTDKPIFAVWGSPSAADDAYYQRLLDGGLPTFHTFSNCVRALRAYADYWTFARKYRSPFARAPKTPLPAAKQARALLETVKSGDALAEEASKALLRAYGIRTSRDVLVASATEAVAAAKKLGLPVVMKAASADIAHKSEHGLVRVGVETVGDVRTSFTELMTKAKRAAGRSGTLNGVLVCEQVSGGVECVVGMSRDDLFGPVVMVGLGGVFVEVLEDVSFRVPPFTKADAVAMVKELKGYPLLQGVRGTKPVDVDALVDVIMKVQRLAMDVGDDIAELDVNPVLVKPKGAIALDALAVRA